LICGPPDKLRKAEGVSCSPNGPFPGECQSGLCDPNASSLQCTTPCGQDTDCTQQTRTKCGVINVMAKLLTACVKP
jgi:hypothetical protein